MPVYKNTSYSRDGIAPGIGKKRMLDLAKQAADALNMKITKVEYETAGEDPKSDGTDNNVTFSVNATTDIAKITAEADDTVTISFNGGAELP